MSTSKSNERQNVYDMHAETAEFLEQVEVVEHGALATIPKEWELIPIESDKLTEWVKRNG